MEAFSRLNLDWPPQYPQSFAEQTSHLTERKREVIFYQEHVCCGGELEKLTEDLFMDINMSITWCRPMTGCSPCIASSSHIWHLNTRKAPWETCDLV